MTWTPAMALGFARSIGIGWCCQLGFEMLDGEDQLQSWFFTEPT